MCPECYAQWDRWNEYPLVHPFKINSAAGYDDTARGALENRRHTVEAWKALIKRQQIAIREVCLREHRVAHPPIETNGTDQTVLAA